MYQLLASLTLLCQVVLQVSVDCLLLAPAVYWNNTNPLFKTSRNSHIIDVTLSDEIDFVCPYFPSNATADSQSSAGYYVIYQVTRQEYENCVLYPDSKALIVVSCSNPRHRKRFTILFQLFQAIPNVAEFIPGSTYYYITTSSGQRDGLSNTELGACYYDNMRLIVRVCCSNTGDDVDDNDIIIQQQTDSWQPKLTTSSKPLLTMSRLRPTMSLLPAVIEEKSLSKPVARPDVNDVLPKHDRLLNTALAVTASTSTLLLITIASSIFCLSVR